jgi:LuxR family maltose regulon positive regulatory protein
LAQWAATLPAGTVAAVAFEPRHNDAVVFGRALVGAVVSIAPTIDPGIASLVAAGGLTLGRSFIDRLLDELEHLDHDIVLVVDDLHAVDNATLVADLAAMLSRLPSTVRVVMAARWDPAMQLRQLRLDGRLVELRADELAFDEREGAELLESVSGRPLPAEHLASIVDHTDGWAAGLQLAAVSLQGTVDPAAFVGAFTGTHQLIAEYLTEEVLDVQSPETRRFLLTTSVLPWLSEELCDAVTGDGNAAEQLRLLQQRSLFVMPFDRDPARLRYHHLFVDLLRHRLTTELGDEVESELHHRAASWLRSNGHPSDAVEQLLDAGAAGEAFDLTLELGEDLYTKGESGTLVRWLTAVQRADPARPAVVDVNLLAAQVCAYQSVNASETYRQIGRRCDLTVGERAAAAAIYACLGLDQLCPEEVAVAAGTTLDLLPSTEGEVTDFLGFGGADSIEAMAENMAAWAEFLSSQVAGSASRFERALTLPGMRFPVWRVHALGASAVVAAWTGSLTDAHRRATAALEVAADFGIGDHQSAAPAHLALALVAVERHEPVGVVTRWLRECEFRNDREARARFRDLWRLFAARFAAGSDGVTRGLELLATPAASHVMPRLLADAERDLHVRLLVASGKTSQARSLLSRTGHRTGTSAAAIDLALAEGDLVAARHHLDLWRPEQTNLTEVVERALRVGRVLDEAGDRGAARSVWLDAAAVAEGDGLRRPFLEVQLPLRSLLSSAPPGVSTFLQSLIEMSSNVEARRSGQSELIEPLTERELAVLDLLPTRMSNRDIAASIYVSINTVKTHLRNIYRKLDAADRDAAVERASELGLL